jgi:hypothetical protein
MTNTTMTDAQNEDVRVGTNVTTAEADRDTGTDAQNEDVKVHTNATTVEADRGTGSSRAIDAIQTVYELEPVQDRNANDVKPAQDTADTDPSTEPAENNEQTHDAAPDPAEAKDNEDNHTRSESPIKAAPSRTTKSLRSVSGDENRSRTTGTIFGIQYQYSKAKWFRLTDYFNLMFSTLGFYLMYCQLLDAKAIDMDLLFADIEQAERLIRQPGIITPCIDEFQSSCIAQYFYAAFFGVCSTVLTGLSLKRLNEHIGSSRVSTFQRSKPHRTVKVQPEAGGENSPNSKIVIFKDKIKSNVFVSSVQAARAKSKAFFKKMKPGGSYFWFKASVTFIIDILLQCLRCFQVEQAYAVTSAPLTIAQTVVMMAHVNTMMAVACKKSVVGFAAVGWLAEIVFDRASLE